MSPYYKIRFLHLDTDYLLDGKCYRVTWSSNGKGLILHGVDDGRSDSYRSYDELHEGYLYATEDGHQYIVNDGMVIYAGDSVRRDTPLSMFPLVTTEEVLAGSRAIECQKAAIRSAMSPSEERALFQPATTTPGRPSSKMATITRKMVVPERVYCSSPVTVAIWADGTKTMARVTEGTVYDPFVGVAVCVLKKVFGYVLPEGRSANGEVGRLLKADHERRAHKYAKNYRRLFRGNPTCDPEIVGDFTAESEEQMWEDPYTANPEPSDG